MIKYFYNLGSGWNNTGFEGSLMMRPIFISDMDAVFANVESHKNFNFVLYPNPVKDFLNIEVFSSNANYFIYDYSGRLIFQGGINNKKQIDISSFNNGLYILSIMFNDGNVSHSKICSITLALKFYYQINSNIFSVNNLEKGIYFVVLMSKSINS